MRPVLAAFGSPVPISFLWGAPGAQVAVPLSNFTASLTARFPLAPGARAQAFAVSVTAFDTLGDASTAQLTVRASDLPAVQLRVNGVESSTVQVRSGTRFGAPACPAVGI